MILSFCASIPCCTDKCHTHLQRLAGVTTSSVCHLTSDHINNELNCISPLVTIYRLDHQQQASESVKCRDDRSLQCQRLGFDISQCSGLESLAASCPCHASIPLSFFSCLVSSLCLCSLCHSWLWQPRDSNRWITLELFSLGWGTCHYFGYHTKNISCVN